MPHTAPTMQRYTVYHMLRHLPPMGSVHITAVPLREIDAATDRMALHHAKELYGNLHQHIAVAPSPTVHEPLAPVYAPRARRA